MLDTRAEVLRILGYLEFSSGRAFLKVTGCGLLAAAVALWPEYDALSPAGHWALFILLLAAGLWTTEAMPAFAVGLLVIGLDIAILGRPGGVLAVDEGDWQAYVAPWSSPLIWLFLGGLVMAEAAARTGLDRWMAGHVLRRVGSSPGRVLAASMGVTFVLSMFMSNTATTAMMLAVIAPILATLPRDEAFAKCLLLGVPMAANVGGMGTLIGTPPNAIAAGALTEAPVDFARWMVAGVPPAAVLLLVSWVYLRRRHRWHLRSVDLSALETQDPGAQAPLWQRLLVMAVFTATVSLWLTGPLHGIPSPVVSFLPITVFAVSGVVGVEQIRRLQWDVLLLLAGGLALGLTVSRTGLADWLVSLLPVGSLGRLPLVLLLVYVTSLLSNFMSNTAATNILVPLALALDGGAGAAGMVVPIALGASAAMCLPISTPPNALAYATRRLRGADFVPGGLLLGLLAPPLSVGWCWLVLG